MNNLSVWITQYQQPVLLVCYGLLLVSLLLKCGERKGRLPHLIFFLILFVMAAVIFLAKDDPGHLDSCGNRAADCCRAQQP